MSCVCDCDENSKILSSQTQQRHRQQSVHSLLDLNILKHNRRRFILLEKSF